jgi:bacterioferritin
MQGSPEVIELLNEVLTAELTAINQYFVHAKMCQNWGFDRIAEVDRDESIDEMKHAEKLVERILDLEGTPNLQRLGAIRVGETVPEQLRLDHALEVEARARLRDGIKLCFDAGDHGSRELLEHILVNEEDHMTWLETQLHLIEVLGETAYLAEQLGS